jgi:hypothetical protein
VDEEGVKDFNPFFGEAATVPGHMSGRHGARRCRAALTRRRHLESVPVVVYPGGDGGDFGGRGLPLQATVLRGAHGAVDPPTRGVTISS